MTERPATIAVTCRGLVTRERERLLVSNDGVVWYAPGGRLVPGESLPECAAREVHEETGLKVDVGDLVYVFEYWEEEFNRHKVECFFLATVRDGRFPGGWRDLDGPVEHMRFFTEEEWKTVNVFPAFVRELDVQTFDDRVYRGFER